MPAFPFLFSYAAYFRVLILYKPYLFNVAPTKLHPQMISMGPGGIERLIETEMDFCNFFWWKLIVVVFEVRQDGLDSHGLDEVVVDI